MTVLARLERRSWLRQVLTLVLVSVAVALVNVPSLLRSSPPGDACGSARPIFGPFIRFQNCDSHVFNLIASDWSQLFTQAGETRLGRPVFLAAGWLMDRVVFAASLGTVNPSDAKPPYYESAEVGYIVLNLLFVAAAVMVTLTLALGRGWQTATALRAQWAPALLLFMLLAVNPVTKAFLWTSHTQMLVILVPVVAVAATRWLLDQRITSRTALFVGLAIGLGILTYASSVVIAVAAATALLMRRSWTQAFALVAGTAALPVAWVVGVRLALGSFYSVETDKFRQFVWILDGLEDGTLVVRIRENIDGLLRSFFEGQSLLALAIAIGVLLLIGFISRVQPSAPQPHLRTIALATGIVVVWYSLFLYAMGFYQTRLSWALIVTVIIAAGALLANTRLGASRSARRVLDSAVVVAVLIWYAAWIAIPEPWF